MIDRGPPPLDRRQWNELIDQVFREKFESLYQYAYSLVKHKETALDLVQDSFLVLMEKPPRLLESTKLGLLKYLCVCIKHRAYNWTRDEKSKAVLSLDAENEEASNLLNVVASSALSAEEHAIARLTYENLHHAVQQLPEKQKKCVQLHYIHGLKHDQVAGTLGTTPEASRSLGRRAIQKLRSVLDSDK